jgi:hypothetical protein
LIFGARYGRDDTSTKRERVSPVVARTRTHLLALRACIGCDARLYSNWVGNKKTACILLHGGFGF